MMKHSLTLFFMALLLFLSLGTARAGLLVDSDWLKAHLGDPHVRIVDVSNHPSSFEKGHIPGAVKVFRHRDLEDYTHYPPVGYPRVQQFVELMGRLGIDNDTTVVAYDDHMNVFAGRFIFLMLLYGHPLERLKLLDGGKEEWVHRGFYLEKGPERSHPVGRYRPGPRRNDLLVGWQEIYRKVVQGMDKKVVLLDVRPKGEFTGEVERSIRGGHIPGAVNLEVAKAILVPGSSRWKGPQELMRLFASIGVTPDKTVFVYCHSGDRSAEAFVVLKELLGFPRVRVYDGTWLEWSVLQALPVEE